MSAHRMRSRPRSGRSAGKIVKRMRPEPITRNPFLNYLQKFRKEHCGLSAVEVAIQGSQEWNAMSQKEKANYINQAQSAPQDKGARFRSRSKSTRRSRFGSRSMSRSRSRSKSRSGSRRTSRK